MSTCPLPRKLHVFVYGTLKRGFYNHYVMGDREDAKFVGVARTVDRFPLVVGSKYNIPYLLHAKGKGHQVEGEVYQISEECLGVLDKLEGYPGYYNRIAIPVTLRGMTDTMSCLVYVLDNFRERLLELEHLSAYTETHHQLYVTPNQRSSDNFKLESIYPGE